MMATLLEKAKTRLFSGDVSAAKELLVRLTQTDSAEGIEAHRLLGLFGLEGSIPYIKENDALSHLEIAAKKGDGEAAFVLWERTKASVWNDLAILAAKHGCVAAIDGLAKTEGKQFFSLFGYLKGIELLKKASADDRVWAMLLLANTLMEEKNPDDALRLWRRAASLGNPEAHYQLAEASTEASWRILHYEAAAKDGHQESMRRLAEHYMKTEQFENRFRILRLLAKAGDETATARLFDDCVEKGKIDEAIEYGKRLSLDDARKAFRLAPLYERVGDFDEAIRHYEIAASGTIPSAMFELGMRLLQGRGVDQNVELAARWIAKAAELCHPEAVYRMGCLYEEGIGVPKDDALAVFWYDHAIAYGHREAKIKQANLKRRRHP